MLLQRHHSRGCRKTRKSRIQAQRIFKTAPLYAVTNPEEAAPQSVLDAFAAFFESLWSPSTNPDGSTVQKAGMSYVYDEDGTLIAQTLTGGATVLTGKPFSAKLSLSASQLTQLRDKHEHIETWWIEHFGFGFDSLTESEARYLIRTPDAQHIRDRIIAAT